MSPVRGVGERGRTVAGPTVVLRWTRRVMVGLSLLAVGAMILVAARVWWVARQDDRRPSDAIVVLGASQYDGRPSPVLRARLAHAKSLYEQDVAPRIVTVGGNRPGDRFTEAGTGRRWLADRGVPRDDVVAVDEGNDTLGSLRAVKSVFVHHGWSSAVLVSDPWHSLRARAMAGDLGLEAVTSPTRQGPAVQTRETELRSIARETLAYLGYQGYRLFGDA